MATPEERVYEADQARLILENPVFQQVLDDIESEIVESWKNAPARDPEGREKLWQLLKLAGKLRSNLQTRLDSGKLAKIELEHREKTLLQRGKEMMGLSA